MDEIINVFIEQFDTLFFVFFALFTLFVFALIANKFASKERKFASKLGLKPSSLINSSIETEDYEVMLNRKPFFQKISAYLKSSRKISYKKINDTLQIRFFMIPAEDINIKKNWGLFLMFGFGVLFILGIFSQFIEDFINELIKGKEADVYALGILFFIIILFLFMPILIYKKFIVHLFTIRTVVLDSMRLTVFDSFFGKNPKIIISLFKQDIKSISWREPYFSEKIINKQPRDKLFLKHKKGKFELISTYPLNDMIRVQEISEKYLSGEIIDKIQKESDEVQKTISETKEIEYPWYKLIFYHIWGLKNVKIAPLIRYLGFNSWIGGFGLFSVIMAIFMHEIEGNSDLLDFRYLIVQGVGSFILFIGWPLNRLFNISDVKNRQLLGTGGTIIFGFSIYLIYSIVPDLKETLESASGIRHSPGLLTILASYGMWLICAFGPLKNVYEKPFGKWIPRVVFIIVAIIDIYITYLIIQTIFFDIKKEF